MYATIQPIPGSHYRPGQRGNDFKPQTAPLRRRDCDHRNTPTAPSSAPIWRRGCATSGHAALVIAGVITNNSVEATVRMAGNLGFAAWLVEDACFTFGRKDWNGIPRSAQEVHALSLANLDGEYCTVTKTDAVL